MERLEVRMLARVAIKGGKSPLAGSPRFPVPGSSGQGQSVPKAKPKGVVDGNPVNIPEPPVRSSAGTKKGMSSGDWKSRFKPVGGVCRNKTQAHYAER